MQATTAKRVRVTMQCVMPLGTVRFCITNVSARKVKSEHVASSLQGHLLLSSWHTHRSGTTQFWNVQTCVATLAVAKYSRPVVGLSRYL